jgi:hypothetical protein
MPERRFDAQLINGLNQTAHVVTENLTQHFVNLPRSGLAAEAFTELAHNHAEGRLDVAAHVVTLHEPLLILGVEVIVAGSACARRKAFVRGKVVLYDGR